jgi:hypothetical protein
MDVLIFGEVYGFTVKANGCVRCDNHSSLN